MKKLLSILMSVIIVITCVGVGVSAISQSDNLQVANMEEYYDENGAYHIKWVDENGNEVSADTGGNGFFSADSITSIPSSFDSRNYNLITSVKNQNPYGTCWAHATCAVAESSLIAQGYETADSVNLSEAHLAWFAGNSYISSSSNEYDLDGETNTDPFNNGGNAIYASLLVARGIGFTNEADYPYSKTASEMQFSSGMYDCNYRIKEMHQYSTSDISMVKETIMTYGAVATAYYHSSTYLKKSTSNGYCYYQSAQTGTNHAVTIVGWDDNYSASNFYETPASDGAWLVKNSWGTSWGDSGYFWLSYCDTSVTHFEKIVAVPKDVSNYDNNYQYNGFRCRSWVSYGTTTFYEGNIFTAEDTQLISGVGFETLVAGQTCVVSVYKNNTSSTNPKSGTLLESQTVDCNYKGYYTINLNNQYEIEKGKKFSVVLKYTASTKAYGTFEGSSYTSSNVTYTYSSKTGQSFLSSNGNSWTDSSSSGYNNAPIKVFTNNNVKTESGISISILPTKQSYFVGESLNLSGMVLNLNYSDGSSEVISDGYTVSGFNSSTTGTKTITVSYNGFTTTFDVTVIAITATKIEIASLPTKTEYTTLDELNTSGLSLLVSYNNGTTETITSGYTVTGYNNKTAGTQTLTVSFAGQTATFTITVKQGYADYTAVNSAIETANAEIAKGCYTDATVENLQSAISAVVYNLKNTEQSTVDGYALAIQNAINALEKKPTIFVPKDNSTAVIDTEREHNLIYGLEPNLSIEELISKYIDTENVIVTASNTILGTGTVITVKSEFTNEVIDEYIIVIFGDTTGDSWYDGQDAVIVNCIVSGMLTREQVGEAVWVAADCNHDGQITVEDAEILQNAGIGNYEVTQLDTENIDTEITSYVPDTNYLTLGENTAGSGSTDSITETVNLDVTYVNESELRRKINNI